MTRREIIDRLRTWVADQHGLVCAAEITDDTPIVEQRILSSLQLVNLLVFIEQMRGRPIDIDSLQPRSFRSLATIYQQFFAEVPHD